MRALFVLGGRIGRAPYLFAALALVLSQHALVAAIYAAHGLQHPRTAEFWLLPLRTLARLPHLPDWALPLAFAFGVAVAWGLALLSFRRASDAARGFGLAALAVTPVIQLAAIAVLSALRPRLVPEEELREAGSRASTIIQGLLAGTAIIVGAVILSALVFGSYCWGLFVLTPFFVGVTTAWIGNRDQTLTPRQSSQLVWSASGLGCLCLIILALEGAVCVLMAVPLGAIAVAAGGALGRKLTLARHTGTARPLASVALLPLVFALEAALPPSIALETHSTILIAAPPPQVWAALIDTAPIAAAPPPIFRFGLAYPIASRIVGAHVGGERLGEFSTGTARERITRWEPGRALAFTVLTQPPSMRELSPYRTVRSPHVQGYFVTSQTSFTLDAVPGGTRLTARASHLLRLDPVLYWEPLARWAIAQNMARVLGNARQAAEAASRYAATTPRARTTGG